MGRALNPGLRVRPVEPADRAAWQPLWDGYNAFYGRAGDTALAGAVTEATWHRFFDPAEPVHALVAERDGAIVGLVHYLFHRSTTAIAPVCYLQDLFVAPDTRGGGVGRALITAVYDAAATAGAARVYWHTRESNAVAMRLYDTLAERPGFVLYRQRPQGTEPATRT